MTYRDIAGATTVFDHQGRRGRIIFDEDPRSPTIGNCQGWIAYQTWHPNVATGAADSGIERLSVLTSWDHANAVLGPLYSATYRGRNVPTAYPDSDNAADLDLVLARLSDADLSA